MAKKIEYEIDITTQQAQANVDELNKSLGLSKDRIIELEKESNDLQNQLDKTPKRQIAAQKDLRDKIIATKKAVKDEKLAVTDIKNEKIKYEKVLKKNESAQKDLASSTQLLDRYTGGYIGNITNVVSGLKNFRSGLTGVTKGTKLFSLALKASGIGLFITAIASLVSYFTNTQRGADKLKQAIDGLSAGFSVITDRVSGLGEILTNVFSQSFSDTLSQIKDNFSGITEEIKEEASAASVLAGELQKVKDQQIDLIVIDAERKKTIAENRLIAEDETRAIGDRIKALDEASQLETDILNDQLRLAKERARISQEQVDLGESSRDEIEENARLQAEVLGLEEASLLKQKSLATRRNALIREANAKQESIRKEAQAEKDKEQADADKKEEERIKKLDDLESKLFEKKRDRDAESNLQKVQLEEQRAIEELDRLKATEEQKKQVEDYYKGLKAEAKVADDEKAEEERLKKQEEDQKDVEALEKIEQQKRAIKEKTFNDAVALAGADSRLGKAILLAKTLMTAKENILEAKKTLIKAQGAVTDATIDSAKSGTAIAQGVAETSKIGFPQNIPMLIAYAAQAVGVGSAIKQAVGKTKAVASSVGASAGGGAGLSTPSVPTASVPPQVQSVGTSGINQLAGVIQGQQETPLRAYVVSNDVTTAQSLDRNIVEEAGI